MGVGGSVMRLQGVLIGGEEDEVVGVEAGGVAGMVVVHPSILMALFLHEARTHRMVVMGYGHHQHQTNDGQGKTYYVGAIPHIFCKDKKKKMQPGCKVLETQAVVSRAAGRPPLAKKQLHRWHQTDISQRHAPMPQPKGASPAIFTSTVTNRPLLLRVEKGPSSLSCFLHPKQVVALNLYHDWVEPRAVEH